MTNTLKQIFAAINQVQTEAELRSQVAPQIGDYFVAKRWGIFFFEQFPYFEPKLKKTLQKGLSIKNNPVVRYLVEHHAPVHEGLVVSSPKVWQILCPRPDHRHVMAGPVVCQGQLVGVVGCTRDRTMSAFNDQNIADLSGICLHLSAWVASLRSQSLVCKIECLTPREIEIAELVAKGWTNAEIGRELWITENSVKQALKRIFRKLEVSSRAEMVAQIFSSSVNKEVS